MPDLQFQDPQYSAPVSPRKPSWLAGLVVRTGFATDEGGAQKVLVIVLVLVVIAIIAVWTI